MGSMRKALVWNAVLVVALTLVCAAQRAWQDGNWAKPLAMPEVGTPYRNYAIETSLVRLDLQETVERGIAAIVSAPDTPVMFAIDGETVYVKQGDSERALRLIQRSEKLKTYAAAGGGHYITAMADQGLTLTLEDNSKWEVDPRGQYKSATWQTMQGVWVRLIPQENGFNYELANTDVDEAVLARLAR
jgi:hypothetical protein